MSRRPNNFDFNYCFFLASTGLAALTLLVGMELFLPRQYYYCLHQFFFSFKALTEDSELLEQKVDNSRARTLDSFS